MKRFFFGLILFICCAAGPSIQFAVAEADHPLSIGAGGGMNMFNRYSWSPAGNILIDYKLDEILTLGLKGGYTVTPDTADFETVNTIEITLLERFYLINWSRLRLYFQGNLGAVILREQDYQRVVAEGGGALGARFYLRYWFAEVYGTYGYPMNFDLGVFLGHSFIP
jgi:hypothetical protein